jgi:hypothetical protein
MKKIFYLIFILSSVICEEKEINSNEEIITCEKTKVFSCGLTEQESAFLIYINSLDDLAKEALLVECVGDIYVVSTILKIKNEQVSLKGDLEVKMLNCKRSIYALADLLKAKYSVPDAFEKEYEQESSADYEQESSEDLESIVNREVKTLEDFLKNNSEENLTESKE